MKIKMLLAGAMALGLVALLAFPAAAGTYVLNASGAGVSIDELFTTSDTQNSDGSYDILSASGTQTVGVVTSAIIGLSGYAGADNEFFVGSPPFDFSGHSFTTTSLGDFNIFSNGGNFELSSSVDPVGYPQNGVELTSLNVSAAPEPAAWLLMLLGIGGIGYALRRQRRRESSFAGAAVA